MLVLILALTNQTQTPAAPKSPQQIEDDKYSAAAGACMSWAEKHSPLAMGDFVDDFQLPRRKKDPKDVYRAGLHYRTKSAGLMMRADCSTLMTHDGNGIILEAQTRPGE